MSKVHLTYKVNGEITKAARCGNNGRNYKYGLRVAMPKEFCVTPRAERCIHCEDIYKAVRDKLLKAQS